MLGPRVQRVADPEMKRRQQAALQIMAKEGVDCIVMHNFGETFGGPFRYLTDSSGAYPLTAILCKEGIAIFSHGVVSSGDIPDFQSVGDRLPESRWTCPALPSTTFLIDKVPEAMVRFIKKHSFKKIGWVGLQFIPGNICLYLTQNLSGVEFVNISAPIDEFRRVKSPYEIERWMKTVELHDKLIAMASASIVPGMSPRQLNLKTMEYALELGAVEFNTFLISIVRGEQLIGPDADEPFQCGDYIWQLIEVAGPGGEWGECARIYRLGAEPDQEWVGIAKNIVAMQDAMAAACKPGVLPQDVFRLGNKLLKEFGYPPENRIFAHGQTYDIVDLPMFIEGETSPLLENEFITIHPGAKPAPVYCNHTDNYLIEKNGARLLNKTPREIIIIPVY